MNQTQNRCKIAAKTTKLKHIIISRRHIIITKQQTNKPTKQNDLGRDRSIRFYSDSL